MESVRKMVGYLKQSATQIYAKVLETKISEDIVRLKHIYASKRLKHSRSIILFLW